MAAPGSRSTKELVDDMLEARSKDTRTYMPAALLAICDLAEQGKARDGVVAVADYRMAFKRLMLEVWPEREDAWYRPMLHHALHRLWQPMQAGREVPYDKRRTSSLNEKSATRIADSLRLDRDLALALQSQESRIALRQLVYAGLEQDAEERSHILADVHSHLDRLDTDSDLLRELLAYDHRQEDRDAFEDLRIRQLAQRVVRQGQSGFRLQLLQAYDSRCCMSDADAPQALEAAHIHPFLGKHSNQVSNGLLLRGDLHTLFDEGLIRVDEAAKIELGRDLRKSTYGHLAGRVLRMPRSEAPQPNRDALKWHLRKSRAQHP